MLGWGLDLEEKSFLCTIFPLIFSFLIFLFFNFLYTLRPSLTSIHPSFLPSFRPSLASLYPSSASVYPILLSLASYFPWLPFFLDCLPVQPLLILLFSTPLLCPISYLIFLTLLNFFFSLLYFFFSAMMRSLMSESYEIRGNFKVRISSSCHHTSDRATIFVIAFVILLIVFLYCRNSQK